VCDTRGVLESAVTCSQCNFSSLKLDDFLDLSIEVRLFISIIFFVITLFLIISIVITLFIIIIIITGSRHRQRETCTSNLHQAHRSR
jgi:hypothetical protein